MSPVRTRRAGLAVAVLALAVGCTPSGKGKTAYVGAQVFDGTGGPPIPDAVIVVGNGRIEQIGTSTDLKVPRGATVVQLDGKWVIPGLVDGHTHVDRWTLARYLAYGVTSVRDVGGNTDSLVVMRSEIDAGTTEGPRLFISGAMIDGAPATWPGATEVFKPEDARRAVDKLVLANVSQVKVYTKIDRTLLSALMDEAKTLNVPVTAHLGRVDAVTAAKLGVSALEHMSGVVEASVRNAAPLLRSHDDFFRGWISSERGWATLDSGSLDRTAQALIKARVTIIPTLIQHQTYAYLQEPTYPGHLDLTGVPAEMQKAWDLPGLARRAGLKTPDYGALQKSRPIEDWFVRYYHAKGGRVVAGTDSPNQLIAPGASLHEELSLLVAAGLSTKDALLSATRDAARLAGADSLGVLTAGGPADFVVLGGDPVKDITNTRKVERVVQFGVDRSEEELRRLVTDPQVKRGMGFSFPIAIPLVLDPLLLIAMVVGRGQWWGLVVQGIYLLLVAIFFWVAVSPTQFAKIQAKVPDLQRANWVMNWMFFFVILPLLLWAFFGLRPMLNIQLPAPEWRG